MFCGFAEAWHDDPFHAVDRLRNQLQRLEIPLSQSNALWNDIAETLARGKSVYPGMEHIATGHADYNRIPSDIEGPCCSDLVAYCLGSENFEDRLVQIEHHVMLNCRQTRSVMFVTSRWDARKWTKHRDAFINMNAHTTVVLDCAGLLIPVLY